MAFFSIPMLIESGPVLEPTWLVGSYRRGNRIVEGNESESYPGMWGSNAVEETSLGS